MNTKNYLRKEHYSIRKLTVGACSVLIGTSLFWLGTQTAVVHADTTTPVTMQTSHSNQIAASKASLSAQQANATVGTPALGDQAKSEDSTQQSQSENKPAEQSLDSVPVQQTKATDKQTNEPKDVQSDKSNQVIDSHTEHTTLTNTKSNLDLIDKEIQENQNNNVNKDSLKNKVDQNTTNIKQASNNNGSNKNYQVFNLNTLTANQKQDIANQLGISLRELDAKKYKITYQTSINEYHKTNDGSANDTEIDKKADVPTINKITLTNDHASETIVYFRQDDGSYKLTYGNGFKDANGDNAPLTIAAGQIKTHWEEGYVGNSDVSNFPKTGTSTSLAKDQSNNPNAEQQESNSSESCTSKARIIATFGDEIAKILGINTKDKEGFEFSVYSNYYGAKATGAVKTFKQGQDISNLSQAQYRQLVDVTDLGQNGWNGININPDAPQVLAYVPGNNYSKKFYMTWAPGKEASTAKVANGVDGTVRIHFGDDTWLDVAVKINVKANQDSGKPDHDKSEFTQKIVYTYNDQEVAYTTIDNIAKGSDLSAETLKNAIDTNVPANYRIASNFNYPAGLTDIQATPAIIYVPLAHNTNDCFNANGQMIYQTADGTTIATGKKIDSHVGDTLTAALLKDWADQGMREGVLKDYVIAQYPASYDVTAKNFTITVIVKAGTEIINPTNPKSPDQKDLFRDVTRKINVHNPDGTVNVTNQVVHFDRIKTINAVTNGVISYGDWQLVAGSAKDWPEFTAPTIAGYTADPSSVAEKTVNADTKNETVDIYYHKSNSGGGNNQPTQPSQPTKPTSPVKPIKPIQPTDPLPPSEPTVVPPTSTPKPTQPIPKSTPTPQPSQASQPTQSTTVKHVKHHNPPKPNTHTTPTPKPTPNPVPKPTPTPKPSYNYNNRPHSEIINTNSSSNIMPYGETTPATISSNVAPHGETSNKPGAIGSNVTPLGQLLPHGDKIGPKGAIVNATGQVVGYIDKSGKAHLTLPQTGENQNNSLNLGLIGLTSLVLAGIITLFGRSDRKRNK